MAVTTESTEPEVAAQAAENDPETITYITKNRPGRPGKGETSIKLPALPRPATFKGIKVDGFLKYWREVDRKFPNRLAVYVYRNWPTVDRVRCKLYKYINVLSVGASIKPDDISDPEQFETFMLHNHGSGDYKLVLNDAGLSREVCQVFPKYRNSDIDPIVEPLASLIVEDPINKPFIESLTRKGVKIPGTYADQENEDEMAKVTTELTGTVDRLVDKTMEMADRVVESSRQREEEATTSRRREPQSADALEAGLRIVSEAAKMGSQIVNSAVAKVGEIQATVAAKPEVSAVDTVKGVVELVKSMTPAAPAAAAPSPSGDILGILLKRLVEQEADSRKAATAAQEAQNQLLRDLMFGRQNPTAAGGPPGLTPLAAQPAGLMGAAPAAAQPKSLVEQVRELKELQEIFGGGGGDDEGGGGGRQSIWEKLLPIALQAGAMISGNIANVIYNLTVAKSGQGKPNAPADMTNTPDQLQELPPAPPNLASNPGVYTNDPVLAGYHQVLAVLKDPLLQSLNKGETGDEFAEKLMDWQGEYAYEALRELGPDQLNRILSTYPPIWEYVSKIPTRYTQFLSEFLAYGETESETDESTAPAPAAVATARGSFPGDKVRPARAGRKSPAPAADPMAQDPLAPTGSSTTMGGMTNKGVHKPPVT